MMTLNLPPLRQIGVPGWKHNTDITICEMYTPCTVLLRSDFSIGDYLAPEFTFVGSKPGRKNGCSCGSTVLEKVGSTAD